MNVYEIVTDKIIKLMEGGEIPWNKPWQGGFNGMPKNYISKKPYQGINAFLLAFSQFNSPYWLTFKQANNLGAKVKKDSKSTLVVFWKLLDSTSRKDSKGNAEKVPLLRYYNVFNADQIEGLPSDAYGIKGTLDFKPLEACEKLIADYKTKPDIRHGENRAYYVPSLDYVNMPVKENFNSIEEYYATLFHELTHSTGHKSRLDRNFDDMGSHFGSEVYSKEELIAEFGASFLCGIAGIENKTIRNSASYLQGWLSKLKSDKKLLVLSANKAQKAVDYILGKEAPAEAEPAEAIA